MTHPVTIYGASDDLIEIEGEASGCDEYNTNEATFILVGDAGAKARVRVSFNCDGVWEILVSQVEEDCELLPVSITGSGYTATAVVQGVDLVVRVADDA